MKKIILFALILIITLFFGYRFFLSPKVIQVSELDNVPMAKVVTPLSTTSPVEKESLILKSKSQILKLAEEKKEVELPKQCVGYWKEVTENSFDDFFEMYSMDKISKSSDCEDFEKQSFPLKILEMVDKSCKKNEQAEFKNRSDCSVALIFYRASLIDYVSGDKGDLNQLDSNTLINKMIGKMLLSAQDKTFKGYDLNIKIAEALISREPDLYAAHKAKIMNLMLKNMEQNNNDFVFNQELEEAINSGELVNETDPQLFEMRAINNMGREDLKEVVEKYNEKNEKNEKSGLGNYYLSMYYWKKGDKARALQEANLAITKEKNDKERARFIDTYNQLKTSQVGSSGQYSFRFDYSFNSIQ